MCEQPTSKGITHIQRHDFAAVSLSVKSIGFKETICLHHCAVNEIQRTSVVLSRFLFVNAHEIRRP